MANKNHHETLLQTLRSAQVWNAFKMNISF
jgi:hypothetical protein